MIEGALLMIWIGIADTQTVAIDHFPTMAECLAAQTAIRQRWGGANIAGDCLPYVVEGEADGR